MSTFGRIALMAIPRITSTRSLFALLASALLALAVTPTPSLGKSRAGSHAAHRGSGARYVSGRVNVAGYTVLAVGYNGKVALSRAQSFRIALPEAKITLQLVNSRGRYAGPVVLAGGSTRVITGMKAGVDVGTIDVVPFKGYAHLAHKLASADLDNSRWAYAAHGVPIGNGLNLGLVASKGKGGGSGAGQDEAHVGIPNEFDIAVPGTHVLKALAPATKAKVAAVADNSRQVLSDPHARTASAGEPTCPTPPAPCDKPPPSGGPAPAPGGGPTPPGGGPAAPAGSGPTPTASSPWMSQMFLEMNETINDDAAGVSISEINSTVQSKLNLKLLNVQASASMLELDCNGLSFCSGGGSGQAVLEGLTQHEPTPGEPPRGPAGGMSTVPFPGSSLDGADGFGELVGPAVPAGLLGTDAGGGGGGGHEFSLDPNATTSQIGSGDVITEVLTEGGATSQIPTTIDFVFNTVPAIASYSDTAGDGAKITYPDSSGLGTRQNPIKVAAGSNGDVVMTFTLYRPQRQGVAGAGEPAFMDVGHLGYELDNAGAPAPGSVGSATAAQCPAMVYSNPSSTLTLETGAPGPPTSEFSPPAGAGELLDSAGDQPASSANTISFTADLTQCLAAKGVSSFPVGQPVTFDISANSQSSADHANQTFTVERVR